MSKNKYQRPGDAPPPEPNSTPASSASPASKEEIATDVSEVARERLSGSDKTQNPSSVAKDAAEAAPGVAGTPADDDTAAKVEAAPTAVQTQDSPGPKARGEQGPDAPTPTPPANAAANPPDPATTTGGGSQGAPLASNPAGTGAATRQPEPTATAATPAATAPAAPTGATAGPSKDAPPAQPGNGAARAADPDNTASAPTAPDAAPTAAAAAAATKEAEKKPEAPATPASPAAAARPAPAAADGAKPAPAARPAAAARPGAAAAGRPGAAGAKPAAPAAPPEPDPEEVTSLRELVPDLTWERRHGYLEVRVPSGQLIPVARAVRGLGYDYLSAVTAVDWRDRVEMLYHCYGWDYVTTPGCMVIRADLPPEPNPLCPSLTTVWVGAELQEREIYDLFGVKFVGHPDLRRILLDDNFPGHPLRKDWTFDYEYILVKHLKYGAEGQDAPPGGEEGFRRV
jgi:NADH-quinone oxidoreductase subunit C